jgi:hypothetical protein
MTGYLEQSDADRGFLEDAFFLEKPFSREAVLHQVGRALKAQLSERPAGSMPLVSNAAFLVGVPRARK